MNIEKSCRNCDRNHACHGNPTIINDVCVYWEPTPEWLIINEIKNLKKEVEELHRGLMIAYEVNKDYKGEILKLKSKLYSNGQALKKRGENLMEDGKT